MPGLIHSQKTEIPVLSHFAVLGSINDKRDVTSLREFLGVSVPNFIRDGFASKPVTDIVGIAIDERHANTVVENPFELVEEVGICKVTGFLKGVVNIAIRCRVIEINAESLLNIGQIQEVGKIFWGGWILVGMTDIIYPTPTV